MIVLISVTAFLCMVGVPVCFVGWLVQTIRKKKNKAAWGIALLCLAAGFVVCIFLTPSKEPAEKAAGTANAEEASTELRASAPPDTRAPEQDEPNDIEGEALLDADESGLLSIDGSITNALTEIGYSYDHAAQIETILRTVGIETLAVDGADGSGQDPEHGLYSVVAYPNGYTEENRRLYFTTEDGVVFYVGFRDEDGGFLKTYADVHVPETKVDPQTWVALQERCETVLDSYFKFPPYYDAWAVGREDDEYAVQCEAHAQNGFGTKDWVFSKVWYHEENGEFAVTAVSIDGVLYELK